MELNEKIIAFREKQNLSQAELAELLGVEEVSVSDWENGLQVPVPKMIINIAKLMGVSANYLISKDEFLPTAKEENQMKDNESEPEKENQVKYSNSKALRIVISIVCAFVIISLILWGIGAINNANEPIKADVLDIEFQIDREYKTGLRIIATPEKAINDLEISFKFFDKDDVIVATVKKTIGNVWAKESFQIIFSFSELGVTSIDDIPRYQTMVTGGTIR